MNAFGRSAAALSAEETAALLPVAAAAAADSALAAAAASEDVVLLLPDGVDLLGAAVGPLHEAANQGLLQRRGRLDERSGKQG